MFSSLIVGCPASLFRLTKLRFLQTRAKDLFHLHVDIMERSTERLAEHARTGLGSDHLLTPFARNFMENERQLSKK